MKRLGSKGQLALGLGATILVGSFAVAKLGQRRVAEPEPSDVVTRPERSAKPLPPAQRECPSEPAVEDATLALPPDEFKKRFSSPACMKNPNGEIAGCGDASLDACEKRMAGLRRAYGTSSQCVARPTEVHCATFTNAYGDTITWCFGTKDECEKHRKTNAGRKKICRINPACERRPL